MAPSGFSGSVTREIIVSKRKGFPSLPTIGYRVSEQPVLSVKIYS